MEPAEYEALARVEATHPWFIERRRLIEQLVRRHACRWPPEAVLDAGCGTGTNLLCWQAWRPKRLVGIDIERAALCEARRRAAMATLLHADLTRLPLRDGCFDVVISSDVIEHIECDAWVVRELARVLAPEGILVLTTPAYRLAYSYHDAHLHHVRRYDAGPLQGLFRAAALRVVHWTRFNVLPMVPLWLYRRFVRGAQASDVGRPLAVPMARVLGRIWATERRLAARLALPVGMTHVVVARRSRRAQGGC